MSLQIYRESTKDSGYTKAEELLKRRKEAAGAELYRIRKMQQAEGKKNKSKDQRRETEQDKNGLREKHEGKTANYKPAQRTETAQPSS